MVATTTVAWQARCWIVPAGGGPAIWTGNASSSVHVAGVSLSLPLVALSLLAVPHTSSISIWGLAPGSQHLYNDSCSVSRTAVNDGAINRWHEGVRTRFGFRDFEAIAGQFLPNNVPIFLRGWSINPPT